jgi:hypothetical protein
MVLPPLPGSETPGEEIICPTEHWKRFSLGFYARKMRLMWVEVSTPRSGGKGGDGKQGWSNGDVESDVADGGLDDGSKGWWPAYKTWKVGLWMEEATLDLTAAEDLE